MGVRMPVSDIRSEGEDQHIRVPDNRCDIVQPALRILLHRIERILQRCDMPPGVGREFPALCLHRIRDSLGIGAVLVIIKIRILVKELLLVLCHPGRIPGLVHLVCPVPEHALVSGQCQDSLSPMI